MHCGILDFIDSTWIYFVQKLCKDLTFFVIYAIVFRHSRFRAGFVSDPQFLLSLRCYYVSGLGCLSPPHTELQMPFI